MAIVQHILNNSIFIYALLLFIIFISLVLIAALELNTYLKRSGYINYKQLLVSPHAPPVSVILPVHNAAEDIIDRIRALLALRYNNFELIVVNDGSSDATLEKVVEFYQMRPVDYAGFERLKTKEVETYYKSSNPVYSKLTLLHKASGGKADALNAGINKAEGKLVLALEKNCFLDQWALLKMVKQVLDDEKRVILVSTALYIANSCEVKNGYLTNVRFPKSLMMAFRALHYLRIFLIEKPAMRRYNGLHSAAGAVSLLDREIVLLSGGYSSKTTKASFELNVRMCSYMHDQGLDYKVVSLPEPVCWVEEPHSFAAVSKQEIDSSRGSLQTLWIHKRIFLKGKYGHLGLITFPYWVFSECITPVFKLLTLLALFGFSIAGSINPETTLLVIFMTYCLAVLLSGVSLLFEEKSYRPYTSISDLARILLMLFIEPLIYQPMTVYWKLRACFTTKKS